MNQAGLRRLKRGLLHKPPLWNRYFVFGLCTLSPGIPRLGELALCRSILSQPIVFSCGYEFGILEFDFCTKQNLTGCQINFELHRSRTKQETRLPKPVSLFYCSALIGIYIYALLPFLWFGWF